MSKQETQIPKAIQDMFTAGAHFGLIKSRRHPSQKPFIFGQKNSIEIINLEKTNEHLEKALAFIAELGKAKKTILFVSSKSEARSLIRSGAEVLGLPFIAGRWIGGLLTNFNEVKKRIEKLKTLEEQKEKGELSKYTKKERLLIDREIEKLNELFGGVRNLTKIPDALFIVDPRKESIAVAEAVKTHVPVVALASTDCDISSVDFPITANDSSRSSIEYFIKRIKEAYSA